MGIRRGADEPLATTGEPRLDVDVILEKAARVPGR